MTQQADPFELKSFAGVYTDDARRKCIVNPTEGFPHFVAVETGETHMIREIISNSFEFSFTRSSWDAVGGTIAFKKEKRHDQICIAYADKESVCATSIPTDVTELSLDFENGLHIAGELIQPAKQQTDLVAVLLHGDGDNDRYDLYDIGMYLVSEGFSVFAYDKRNAGKSKGPDVTGDSYDEVSRVYADDATRIVSQLMKTYPKKRFGVVGVSQGGWIGSIVSANIPDLAFYVNIAGNVSVGWKQWKHYMISYLKRNGYAKIDIAEAEDYFGSFFAVGLGHRSFTEYKAKFTKYQDREWLKQLDKRKLVKWKDKETAIRVVKRNSNDPSIDVKNVNSPSLGIFFEFDHSTPPDSPAIFLESLKTSKSKDFNVRVFPNSTHGGWVVDSYFFDSSKITRKEPKAYHYIANWLKRL